MKHFVDWADREGLESYLQLQMIAHQLYQRFGLEDVRSFDTELAQWDPTRKLGIHRVICMLRPPKLLREQRYWS